MPLFTELPRAGVPGNQASGIIYEILGYSEVLENKTKAGVERPGRKVVGLGFVCRRGEMILPAAC